MEEMALLEHRLVSLIVGMGPATQGDRSGPGPCMGP